MESGIEISGAHVVVLGRSMIVGKPLALLLMQKGKCGMQPLRWCIREAEISRRSRGRPTSLMAAIGQAGFVRQEHVREGAVVIDVGINRVEDATSSARLSTGRRRGV